VALNAGAIVRGETRVYDPYDLAAGRAAPRLLLDVGHELTLAVGARWRVVHWLALAAEATGLVPLVGARPDFTADLLGGVQIFPARELTVSLGGGAGIVPTADRRDLFRVFAGVSWTPIVGDRGVLVSSADRDHDGIPDGADLCPDEPEDRDGFDDDDGCPDLDNDQDGIPDRLDRCPNEPEDRDGFADDDGCPENDNDGDGIIDVQDHCPNEPEDRDGFADDDGCPDEDNDGDGIPDRLDRCPNEPETRNGVDDDDGCPDRGGEVVVLSHQILLPEPLTFEAGNARVAPRSHALLDHVADQMHARPELKRVRIEGHTDDIGSATANRELSQARANAVRDYLIRRGVAAERLQAVGFGNTRPIDKQRTAEARAKNRRVELIVVEQ
jgi:outer membrane protein OmpA-like peptidoglycan-associated protein